MAVETIRPNSTESYSGWTTIGCSLGSHHLCVDEGWPSDDEATYIEGSPGCDIQFGLEDPTFEGTCVQARVHLRTYTTTTAGVVTTTTTTVPGEVLTVELYYNDGQNDVQISSQEVATDEEYSFEGYFDYYTEWVDFRDLELRLTAADLASMEVRLRDATGWSRNVKISTVEVELDNTFSVIDIRPDNRSSGIATGTTIEVDFNRPVDTTTVTTESFLVALRAYKNWNNTTVSTNEVVEGTISFTNSDYTAVFTPDTSLFEQADYDVILDDTIAAANAAETLDAIYGSTFQTGIVEEVPDEVSDPQIAPPLTDYPEHLESLSVVSTYPAQYSAQVPIDLASDPEGEGVIRITLNKDIATYESNITVGPINGDDSVVTPDYDFNHTPTVDGDALELDPSDFEQNSVVIVSLKDITATDGSVLQEYVLTFATEINPAYATVAQVKVRLGPYAENTTDIAIAMLIYEYSIMADLLVPSTIGNAALVALAKQQWVICKVAYDLVFANQLDSQGKSKRLADMEVSYSGVSPREKEALYDKFKDCIEKWEEVLQTGGTGVRPVVTIKGLYDPDRPQVGRGWTQRPNAAPAANTVVQKVIGRRGVKALRDPRLYYEKNRQVVYRTSRDWD